MTILSYAIWRSGTLQNATNNKFILGQTRSATIPHMNCLIFPYLRSRKNIYIWIKNSSRMPQDSKWNQNYKTWKKKSCYIKRRKESYLKLPKANQSTREKGGISNVHSRDLFYQMIGELEVRSDCGFKLPEPNVKITAKQNNHYYAVRKSEIKVKWQTLVILWILEILKCSQSNQEDPRKYLNSISNLKSF